MSLSINETQHNNTISSAKMLSIVQNLVMLSVMTPTEWVCFVDKGAHPLNAPATLSIMTFSLTKSKT